MRKPDLKNGKQNQLNFYKLISEEIKKDIIENDLDLDEIATKAGLSYEQALESLSLLHPDISVFFNLKKTIDEIKICK